MLEALHVKDVPHVHKDKLAETKRQQAALHEAHKAQERHEKELKEQRRQGEAHVHKQARALNLVLDPEQKHSKRAIKEQRDALRHAEKASTAVVCEHGINRCKICFPHKPESHKIHDHDLKAQRQQQEGEQDDQ